MMSLKSSSECKCCLVATESRQTGQSFCVNSLQDYKEKNSIMTLPRKQKTKPIFFNGKCINFINTDIPRLPKGIRSEKCVVKRFRRCANVIQCTYTNLDSTV